MIRPLLLVAALLWSGAAFAQSDSATQLQTQQTNRDIGRLQEAPSPRELSNRIDSLEKAVALAHDDQVRVPTIVQQAVATTKEVVENLIVALRDVHNQKFTGVEQRFVDLEKRIDDAKTASSTAISAALQSKTDTTNKSEQTLLAAIADERHIAESQNNALTQQLNDLKSRFDRVEGQLVGQQVASQTAKTDTFNSTSIMLAAIGAIGVMVGIFAAFSRRQQIIV